MIPDERAEDQIAVALTAKAVKNTMLIAPNTRHL